MKMKKILALSVTAMMTLSSIANAAFYVDSENYAVADKIPTKAEIQDSETGIKPRANFDVETLTFDSAKALYKEKTGSDVGRGFTALSDAANDFYKVSISVDNIGDLLNGTLDTSPWPEAYLRVYSIVVDVPDFKPNTNSTPFTSLEGVAWKLGASAVTGGYAFSWTASDAATGAYPTASNTLIKDCVIPTAEFLVVLNEGETISETPVVTVTFSVKDATSVQSVDTKSYTATTLEIPAVETAKPVEFSAALAEKTANGYIWALTFTQSADKLASFKANFEANGVEPVERVMQDVSAVASVLGGKAAPVVLNVGLETTKTLKAATFTADDAVEATPAKVVNAPISK